MNATYWIPDTRAGVELRTRNLRSVCRVCSRAERHPCAWNRWQANIQISSLHRRKQWRWFKAVNNPNFQIILDVTSTAAENLDMPTQIRTYAEHVAHFHTNDDNGYLPGSGNVDYPPIIKALKEINYTGYLSTEVFNFEPDPETIARRSIEFLQPLVG